MAHTDTVSSFRRLAAFCYDVFIIASLWLIATFVALFINKGQTIEAGSILFQAFLFLVCFGFYVWFWTHGGQTLGMTAWKFKVTTLDGQSLNFKQASKRFLSALLFNAPLGMAFWMSLFHREQKTLYDVFSKTKLTRKV